MNTLMLLVALALVFAGLYWIGLALLNRWLRKQAEQGIVGIIVSILVLLLVASAIIFGVSTFLSYLIAYTFGGAFIGLVFAIPVYFGMPWYGLILYGASIGVLTYFGWMFYTRPLRALPVQRLREIPECETLWVKLSDLARYKGISLPKLWDQYFDQLVQPMTQALVLVAFKKGGDMYMGGVTKTGHEFSGRPAFYGTATFMSNLCNIYVTEERAKRLI